MSKATDYVKSLQTIIHQPCLDLTRSGTTSKVTSNGELLIYKRNTGITDHSGLTVATLTADEAVMLANWIYETFTDPEVSNEL
jgi:hypothetical protein